MNKDVIRVIPGKRDDVETILNPTEANWSHTTPETHGLNQSINSLSFEDDSSFPIAAIIVPLLLCLLCAVLVMGYIFRKKLKDWMDYDTKEHGANLDLTANKFDTSADLNETQQESNETQANTSALPLMALNHGE